MSENRHSTVAPAVWGLVLAGGRGRRLGRDKGELEYHGVPQAVWGLRVLDGLCRHAFVSIRPDQSQSPAYAGLPTIVDAGASAGPASGLAAAFARSPAAAWLLIAADMPLLTNDLLAQLVAHRDPAALATAYRRRDGTPEPLCAIWEPAAATALRTSTPERGVSLRALLEKGPARLLEAQDEEALMSVNTAADDATIRARLSRRSARLM
jgi:molybdenum cofactor guanylyltransferase